jgi:chaperonin GroES
MPDYTQDIDAMLKEGIAAGRGPAISRYVPLANFVLVQRIDEAADVTPGGMFIPQIAKTQSNKGRVIAVGEGRIIGGRIEPIPLAAGDIVLFSKWGAEEVTLDGEEYLLLRYDEIKLKERLVLG